MDVPARLTVVKLGGSLHSDPAVLLDWLRVLATHGAGQVVIVPGGGAFADAVRAAQSAWGFDDLAAHNMAVLAMAQTAHLLHSLAPTTRLESDVEALRPALALGLTAIWLPFDALRSAPDATTTWATSSDTLALILARRLGAERLVVVKSCAVDSCASLTDLAVGGVIDGAFVNAAADALCQIDVVDQHGLRPLIAWLDDARPLTPDR